MDSRVLTATGWTQFLNHAERLLQFGNGERGIPVSAWQDELARLRVWADDIDIYQASGHGSLDERLRDLPLVKSQILRQLTRIQRLVRDLEDESREYTESQAPQLSESEPDSDVDIEEEQLARTNSQYIYTHLEESISGLNRMSSILSQHTTTYTSPAGSAPAISSSLEEQLKSREEEPSQTESFSSEKNVPSEASDIEASPDLPQQRPASTSPPRYQGWRGLPGWICVSVTLSARFLPLECF
ncbi:hypothetical protein BJX61DRAFT_543605 [Aspergillus egyptiacus]|nr:hypothetical protein BJX61DRAFT_543605 [Aspergillus egyptiacus]